MILRRFFDEKLAQTSYLVACDHSRLAAIARTLRGWDAAIDSLEVSIALLPRESGLAAALGRAGSVVTAQDDVGVLLRRP